MTKKRYRLSNSLDGDKIAINADNLVEAKEVFNQFNCQNLRDYHDLYLSCDTLLLAFVFGDFHMVEKMKNDSSLQTTYK